jgi:hypothetical protein
MPVPGRMIAIHPGGNPGIGRAKQNSETGVVHCGK